MADDDTGRTEPNATGTDTTDTDTAAQPTTGRHHQQSGKRHWGHIYGTRIRTTTAAMIVVFLALLALYGWTSQHYGVVAPVQPTPAPKTTTPVYTYSTPTSTPPSRSSTESTTPKAGESGSVSGEVPAPAPPVDSTEITIPGLPGITLPRLGGQTTTPATTTQP
ncbi:hypothetical protein ACWDTI_13665 [Gordonia sp. NPDC003424]